MKKGRVYKSQYIKISELTQKLLTSFPECIIGYNEKDLIFFQNETAFTFQEKYNQLGSMRAIFEKMRDCENNSVNLFDDLNTFLSQDDHQQGGAKQHKVKNYLEY